jgi:hypothetical protein
MFLKRSYQKEMMDDFSIIDERIDTALSDLKIVNKFLGGTETSIAGFKILFNGKKISNLRVLDIGAGASDIFYKLNDKFSNIHFYSLDRSKKICKMLSERSGTIPIFGDVLHAPVIPKSVDVVHSSLFIHHFTEEEIKEIIISSLLTANCGIVINDLRRSVLALIGIILLTSLFSKSVLVKNDAPISVKRGFLKRELINLLEDLGINKYKIKRKWAFRWLIVIPGQQLS